MLLQTMRVHQKKDSKLKGTSTTEDKIIVLRTERSNEGLHTEPLDPTPTLSSPPHLALRTCQPDL